MAKFEVRITGIDSKAEREKLTRVEAALMSQTEAVFPESHVEIVSRYRGNSVRLKRALADETIHVRSGR